MIKTRIKYDEKMLGEKLKMIKARNLINMELNGMENKRIKRKSRVNVITYKK